MSKDSEQSVRNRGGASTNIRSSAAAGGTTGGFSKATGGANMKESTQSVKMDTSMVEGENKSGRNTPSERSLINDSGIIDKNEIE